MVLIQSNPPNDSITPKKPTMILLQLVLLRIIATLLLPRCVEAHRTIPHGVSCSSQFSSPETALRIPDAKVSWASPRIFTCDKRIFWLEAEANEHAQPFAMTVTVPVIDRFRNVRVSVALIGPSLPVLQDDIAVPEEVRAYCEKSGAGARVFHSPQDQSTCRHLTSDRMIEASSIVNDRCHFYEPFEGTNSWVVLDQVCNVPEPGVYKIAVFVQGGTTAKAAFSMSGREDFLNRYDVPKSTCPFCGTHAEENPAYASHFFEQNSMARYGGFPPLIDCRMDPASAIHLNPTKDQCPPIMTTGTVSQQQSSSSCVLECSSDGTCHRQKALDGNCTFSISWSLQPKFDKAPVSSVTIWKGDNIHFYYPADRGSAHNLFQLADEAFFDECEFSNATALADVEDICVGHTITFDEAGTFYFSCGISCTRRSVDYDPMLCHCTIGQKLIVHVVQDGTSNEGDDRRNDKQHTTKTRVDDMGASTRTPFLVDKTDETECCVPPKLIASWI